MADEDFLDDDDYVLSDTEMPLTDDEEEQFNNDDLFDNDDDILPTDDVLPVEDEIDEISTTEDDEIEEEHYVITNKKTTLPILTKYERQFLLGYRVQQIVNGSIVLIDVEKLKKEKKEINVRMIAEQELLEKKIPFKIKRKLPNGTIEIWDIEDLMII